MFHVPHQLLRFRAPTVPSMTLDGEKLVGSTRITRRIEQHWPDPPLYGRAGVDEAERWAEEELQPVARRLVAWATTRHPAAVPSLFADSKLPLPPLALRAMAPVVTRLGRLRNGASDDAVRADLAALPGHLERIDAWIAAGVIGAAEPTAADLQIGSNLGLLLAIEDVARLIGRHERVVQLSRRWFPTYPGHVPAGVVPAAWLRP